MTRELLTRALGALGAPHLGDCEKLREDIRAALAQPEPEPVAYGMPRADGLILDVITPEEHESYSGEYTVPLYAAPPTAPAEPCYCDRMQIGVPGVSCGDCPRDYKPAAPAPAVPAECCRNELLTALHTLASNYENALGMFGQDGEGRRKAEGDLAHAMKVAAKHNRNGPGCAAPAVPLTDEQFADIVAEASLTVDLAANPLKLLAFARAVLSAAPVAPVVPDGAHAAMLEALNQATSAEYWAPLGSTCKKHAKAAREAIQAALSAAPAVPLTREQQIAIREAHCNTASDEYFGARPQVDDATKRRIYEAGFKEGWGSGIGGGGK